MYRWKRRSRGGKTCDGASGGKSVNIEPANRRAVEQAKVRGNQDQVRGTQRRKGASLRRGEHASRRKGGDRLSVTSVEREKEIRRLGD